MVCVTGGNGGLCWFQPRFFDFSHSFCCHSVPTACLQCCWLCWRLICWSVGSNVLKFTCGNKRKKKTYIIEKQWRTLRKFRSVFAKPSTQRLATDSGQVANKFGELFQGKALIIHDAAKSSTDHWRIERQLQIKARGRSNQVECKKFLTIFSDLFRVSENVASQVYFVRIPPEWPHLSLSFSPMLRP